MRLLKWALALTLLIGVPAAAHASIYQPSPADLNDLDSSKAYAWNIYVAANGVGPITSAKLTFSDAYNADLTANELFIHLFSFAYIPGNIGTSNWVYEFGDGTGISDVYTGGTVPSWVVGNISLTQLSFPAAGQTPGTTPGDPMTEVGKRWRTYDEGSQSNGTWIATAGSNLNGTQYYDYTYTFSATELNHLNSFIGDGWIALGFDPDAHIYNSGIKLDLTSTSALPQNPEPASLILLGTGMAMAMARAKAIQKRRKAAQSNVL